MPPIHQLPQHSRAAIRNLSTQTVSAYPSADLSVHPAVDKDLILYASGPSSILHLGKYGAYFFASLENMPAFIGGYMPEPFDLNGVDSGNPVVLDLSVDGVSCSATLASGDFANFAAAAATEVCAALISQLSSYGVGASTYSDPSTGFLVNVLNVQTLGKAGTISQVSGNAAAVLGLDYTGDVWSGGSRLTCDDIYISTASNCNAPRIAAASPLFLVSEARTGSGFQVYNYVDKTVMFVSELAGLSTATNPVFSVSNNGAPRAAIKAAGDIVCSSGISCRTLNVGDQIKSNKIISGTASLTGLDVRGPAVFSSCVTMQQLKVLGNADITNNLTGLSLLSAKGFITASAASIYSLNVASSMAVKTLSSVANTVNASYASVSVDLSSGYNVWLRLHVSASGVSLQNAVSGSQYNFYIEQAQADSLLNWPSGLFKWSGGNPPVLSTAQNSVDLITAFYNGTSFYATSFLNFA